MQGSSLSPPKWLCLHSVSSVLSQKTFSLSWVGIRRVQGLGTLDRKERDGGDSLVGNAIITGSSELDLRGRERLQEVRSTGCAESTTMNGCSMGTNSLGCYRTELSPLGLGRVGAVHGIRRYSLQSFVCGIPGLGQRLRARQWPYLNSQRFFAREPVVRIDSKKGVVDVEVVPEDETFLFKFSSSENDSVAAFDGSYSSSVSDDGILEDNGLRRKKQKSSKNELTMERAKECESESDSESEDDEENGKGTEKHEKKSKELIASKRNKDLKREKLKTTGSFGNHEKNSDSDSEDDEGDHDIKVKTLRKGDDLERKVKSEYKIDGKKLKKALKERAEVQLNSKSGLEYDEDSDSDLEDEEDEKQRMKDEKKKAKAKLKLLEKEGKEDRKMKKLAYKGELDSDENSDSDSEDEEVEKQRANDKMKKAEAKLKLMEKEVKENRKMKKLAYKGELESDEDSDSDREDDEDEKQRTKAKLKLIEKEYKDNKKMKKLALKGELESDQESDSDSEDEEEDEKQTKTKLKRVKNLEEEYRKAQKSIEKAKLTSDEQSDSDSEEEEHEENEKKYTKEEKRKIAKAKLKLIEEMDRENMKQKEEKKLLKAVKLLEDVSDSDSEDDSEHEHDLQRKTKLALKEKTNEELSSEDESEEEDDETTDFISETKEDEEEFDIIEDEISAREIEDEFAEKIEDEMEEFEDEDDGFWDDEEADVVAGDGGDGGGVVLGGTEWGKLAFALAEQVALEAGSDLSLFAFKVCPDRVIRVRLDKLSDRYGSPTIGDIDSFTRKFCNVLEEAGEAGTLPKDFDVEVSSPGAERVLKLPGDLDRFKEFPMYVQYWEGATGTEIGHIENSLEKDGVLELESLDLESGLSVWKIANVKLNREAKGKGRPLTSKQKKWRAELPIGSLKQVRLYMDV